MSKLCTFASSSNSAANFVVIDMLLYCFMMSVEALNIPVRAGLGPTPQWSFAAYLSARPARSSHQSWHGAGTLVATGGLNALQNIMGQKY